MIDLNLYPKFRLDVQGKNTNVYPLVSIGTIGDEDTIYISTVRESLTVDGEVKDFYDYGLKVSNIKENINVRQRKFSISNVEIILSNIDRGRERLSDKIEKFFNKNVNIYYKSQTCTNINECLPVYSGTLKKVRYEQKDLKITLEDRTQEIFHKDVPISNIGVDNLGLPQPCTTTTSTI